MGGLLFEVSFCHVEDFCSLQTFRYSKKSFIAADFFSTCMVSCGSKPVYFTVLRSMGCSRQVLGAVRQLSTCLPPSGYLERLLELKDWARCPGFRKNGKEI